MIIQVWRSLLNKPLYMQCTWLVCAGPEEASKSGVEMLAVASDPPVRQQACFGHVYRGSELHQREQERVQLGIWVPKTLQQLSPVQVTDHRNSRSLQTNCGRQARDCLRGKLIRAGLAGHVCQSGFVSRASIVRIQPAELDRLTPASNYLRLGEAFIGRSGALWVGPERKGQP